MSESHQIDALQLDACFLNLTELCLQDIMNSSARLVKLTQASDSVIPCDFITYIIKLYIFYAIVFHTICQFVSVLQCF